MFVRSPASYGVSANNVSTSLYTYTAAARGDAFQLQVQARDNRRYSGPVPSSAPTQRRYALRWNFLPATSSGRAMYRWIT